MMSGTNIPRIVVAGVSSGVGKTTVAVALIAALRRRGLKAAAFKCGPDYLDPTYLSCAGDTPACNLDGWMMGRDEVIAHFVERSTSADIAIIEGVMGLFDGVSETSIEGSTAQIAEWLNAPVILVVDASGMARSLAALVKGFVEFEAGVRVAGAVVNRVGSRSHVQLLQRAQRQPPVLGGLPKSPDHAFSERHLGLRTATRETLSDEMLRYWSDTVEAWVDVDAILKLASSAQELNSVPLSISPSKEPACRIAIARDDAFHFYYDYNLELWRGLGATLGSFSPLADSRLPDADGVYIGGGYPELHARELSANGSMLAAVRQFAHDGAPIYGECGGMMYLSRAIHTQAGERVELAGLLPVECRMNSKLRALGYVEAELQCDCLLGPRGMRLRGHQFRYSEPEFLKPPNLYSIRKRRSGDVEAEGCCAGSVLGSYVHAHWASNPLIARNFVQACVRRRSVSA